MNGFLRNGVEEKWGLEVWIPSLFFMISKIGMVFGCSIPLIFFEYNLFGGKGSIHIILLFWIGGFFSFFFFR